MRENYGFVSPKIPTTASPVWIPTLMLAFFPSFKVIDLMKEIALQEKSETLTE